MTQNQEEKMYGGSRESRFNGNYAFGGQNETEFQRDTRLSYSNPANPLNNLFNCPNASERQRNVRNPKHPSFPGFGGPNETALQRETILRNFKRKTVTFKNFI